MAEFRRPAHRRVAALLARMDAEFLSRAQCSLGGGTQLALAHGEYRESRDLDFLVSSREGIRLVRETVGARSLGGLFRGRVALAREVVSDRDAVRTFVAADDGEPIKLEIIYEARIEVSGRMDAALGVPVLDPACAVAEKLLANTDRGMDELFRSRDVVDLAFVSLSTSGKTLRAGLALAQAAYGAAVLKALSAAVRKLELDARYRRQCVEDLMIEDAKKLREGLAKLRGLKRAG